MRGITLLAYLFPFTEGGVEKIPHLKFSRHSHAKQEILAETVFNSSFDGRHSPANIVVIEGNYTLDELNNWLKLAVGGLATEEIYFWTYNFDIAENKAFIRLNELASLEDAEAVRDRLGIPAAAIEIIQEGGKIGLKR